MVKRFIQLFVLLNTIFCSALVFAQPPWTKYAYFQNFGGLNDQMSTTEIADNEATEIQNIIFDTGGALRKRYGWEHIPKSPQVEKVATGTTVAVTGLSYLKLDNGNRYLVAVCYNNSAGFNNLITIKKKNYTTGGGPVAGSWDTIDGCVNDTVYSSSLQCDFAIARNVLIFTTGEQHTPYKWSGTGGVQDLTTDTDCPNATIVKYHKNFLFLSGNSAYPSRVWFGEVDSITSFVATDFFDVETSDGSAVHAIVSAYDSLYIWKEHSIWRLSGYSRDSFRLEKVIDHVGALSQFGVTATDEGIYFVSSLGDSYHYDGAYTLTPISSKITTTIQNINKDRIGNIHVVPYSTYRFHDTDFYVSVSNSASPYNNLILMYDKKFKAWTKLVGINANQMCVAEGDTPGEQIYFGTYDGYVGRYPTNKYFDGNTATGTIQAIYQTKWFRYPEMCLGDKYWRLLKVYAISSEGATLYAECKSDYEASGRVFDIGLSSSQALWDVFVWDVDTWGGDLVVVGRKEVEKGVSMFQTKFTNSDASYGFTLLGFENFLEPTSRI